MTSDQILWTVVICLICLLIYTVMEDDTRPPHRFA